MNLHYQVVLKVRAGGITGWLDGKQLSELPMLDTGLALPRPWKIGEAIGIGTNRQAIFHVVRIFEHDGKGAPIARYKAEAARPVRSADTSGSISLTARKPIAIQTGWDQFRAGSNPGKHPVTVHGKACDKYLFAHAASSLLYEIPDSAIAFRAVGVKPGGKFNQKEGDWRYIVYVDGDEAFISPSINQSNGTVGVDVSIPKGARQIELRVDAMGAETHDHAIWAHPEFLMSR